MGSTLIGIKDERSSGYPERLLQNKDDIFPPLELLCTGKEKNVELGATTYTALHRNDGDLHWCSPGTIHQWCGDWNNKAVTNSKPNSCSGCEV